MTSYFCISVPCNEKDIFFWLLVLEGPVGLHRTTELMLLQHYWLGHRLGLLWYWMVCLGNEQRPFCHFWDCTQVLHFGLFCWLWGQEDCLPSEPQGKPNTINGKREIFLFVFTELVCFCFLWAQEKQNWRNSRQYEYVYKCSCGLVSDRRPGVQTSGKTQDSTLSSPIAKLFLPGFLTVLKPRALEEVQGKDEKFILCFCFSQRPADLERWMVAGDKDQEVYRLMSGLWESYLSFPVLSSQG